MRETCGKFCGVLARRLSGEFCATRLKETCGRVLREIFGKEFCERLAAADCWGVLWQSCGRLAGAFVENFVGEFCGKLLLESFEETSG